MKVAIIYNKDVKGVINTFGMQNKEFYNEQTVKKVAASLEKSGHNVAIMDGNKQIIERLENFMPRVIEGEQMGMVFNMAYGIQGESRYTHIPSLLEMLGVPYIGSSPSGHAIALDKILTKIIWKNNDLPTPDFWVFNSSKENLSKVQFPVIVKPKMESVSFGLQVVYHEESLKNAIDYIVSEFKQQALVEQFIRGREFAVGILGNSPLEAFPVLEIDLNGDPDAIQTVEDKKMHPKNKICPADISPELAKKMQSLSKKAFNSLNLRDFSRVDIRMDENGNIYLLEINSMASLSASGSYPKAASVAGYNFDKLVNKMLDVASVRYFSNSLLSQFPDEKKKGKISLPARMLTFIKSRQAQNEKLLKKLIDINTHYRNIDGVNLTSDVISQELSSLGFVQTIYPQLEVGNIRFLSNSGNKELDYLILLSIDNKNPLADHENLTINEQYMEGTGIWENKGGIAITLSALQALRFAKKLKKINVGIMLITDSNLDNPYSKSIILQQSNQAKHILSINGSSKDSGLVLSRSGSAQYRLEVKLLEKDNSENVSHTAVCFNKILSQISALSKNDSENVIAPYHIEFSSNIFKKYAYGSAGISVRFNSAETLVDIDEKIKKILSPYKRSKICKVQFEGGIKRPPMPHSKINDDFYQKIQKISKSIDVRIKKEHRWSSSDICHINSDIPKIDGLGPVGEFLNNGNERVNRHSMIERALLLSMILTKDL